MRGLSEVSSAIVPHAPHYLRDFAKGARKELTPQEQLVWKWLRDRRFGGHKFRRQHPLGPYVADFYCAELKLVIELDGAYHNTSWGEERDLFRDEAMQAHGITVVRITNDELRDYTDVVEERIRWAIEQASR
jgi:very-short-patch-repair endonuclease